MFVLGYQSLVLLRFGNSRFTDQCLLISKTSAECKNISTKWEEMCHTIKTESTHSVGNTSDLKKTDLSRRKVYVITSDGYVYGRETDFHTPMPFTKVTRIPFKRFGHEALIHLQTNIIYLAVKRKYDIIIFYRELLSSDRMQELKTGKIIRGFCLESSGKLIIATQRTVKFDFLCLEQER